MCKTDKDNLTLIPDTGISYSQEYALLKRVFRYLGYQFTKTTHLFRGAGSRHLSEIGVEYHQISSLGVWEDGERLQSHYLTGMPLQAMLGIAGVENFNARDRPVYLCPRSDVPVPKELSRMIFPFLDRYIEEREDGSGSTYPALRDPGLFDKPKTAEHFLFVLYWMRDVIIQVR